MSYENQSAGLDDDFDGFATGLADELSSLESDGTEDGSVEALEASDVDSESSAEAQESDESVDVDELQTPEQKSEAAQQQAAARQEPPVQEMFASTVERALKQQQQHFQEVAQEAARRHREEVAAMRREVAAMRKRVEQPAQEEPKSALGDPLDWVGQGGDVETYKLLAGIRDEAARKVAAGEQKYKSLENRINLMMHNQRKKEAEVAERERFTRIDSHFRNTTAKAGEVHERFKKPEWVGIMNGLLMSAGFVASHDGKEPTSAMNAVEIAKRLDSLVASEVDAEIKRRVAAVKKSRSNVASPGKGGGSKPGAKKKAPSKNTDRAISDMIDGLFE